MSLPVSHKTSDVVNSPRKKLRLLAEVTGIVIAPLRASLTEEELVSMYPDHVNVSSCVELLFIICPDT